MTQCDMGPETAERYVGGDMLEPERSSFEEHFFACDGCFRLVQALGDARHVLAETAGQGLPSGASTFGTVPATAARHLPLKWMAIAASLVVGVFVWNVSGPADAPAEIAPTTEAPIAQPQPAPSTPPPQAPAVSPAPASAPTVSSSQGRLERWSAVVPPQYVALPTRSAPDENNAKDGADTQTFNEAMTHYSAGRYRQAAGGLQVLADRAPAAHVHFFLGISELMAGNVARARGALQRTAESGVSPYADEAHFYLAKAALRAGDLTTGARELQIAVEREAGPDGDAAKLLAELKRVAK